MSTLPAIPPNSLTEPFYEGSVQRLFAVPDRDDLMVTQTTARGSVFDVGALFEIPGHDVNRAVFRHVLYSSLGEAGGVWEGVKASIESAPELSEDYRAELLAGPLEECVSKGGHTHHAGMLDAVTGEVAEEGVPANPSAYNVVRRFQILKPERTEYLGAHLFDYSKFSKEDGFVVPLEYIVRFGITSGSSVFKKYQRMDERGRKAFEAELGVTKPLEAWQFLERPITDFTSKFEPEDRMVSKQEALAMCGLSGDLFVKSGKMGVLGAWVVRHLLEKIGLLLWDIKWEFAIDGEDLVFVDTIDTDSFRATAFVEREGERFVCHFNKQSMRDYFHIFHGDWIEQIKVAKDKGAEQGVAFTELLDVEPPTVAPGFIDMQERKMTLIRDYMLGKAEAADVKSGLEAIGAEEVNYYADQGKLDGYRALCGV